MPKRLFLPNRKSPTAYRDTFHEKGKEKLFGFINLDSFNPEEQKTVIEALSLSHIETYLVSGQNLVIFSDAIDDSDDRKLMLGQNPVRGFAYETEGDDDTGTWGLVFNSGLDDIRNIGARITEGKKHTKTAAFYLTFAGDLQSRRETVLGLVGSILEWNVDIISTGWKWDKHNRRAFVERMNQERGKRIG